MKVLVIAPHYHTFIKGQVDAVAKHVDKVDVLIHHNYLADIAGHLPFPYFRHVKKFSKKNLTDFAGTPANVEVKVVSTVYFRPDGRNLSLGKKLAELFHRTLVRLGNEFDLIHAHFAWPSGYAAAELSNRLDLPLVVTAHGYDVYDLPFRSELWFQRVKFVFDSADHVITVSKGNYEALTNKISVSPEKVSIIPNGYSSSLFRPMDKTLARQTLGLPINRKILLNVANLVPIKGHAYLIEAMKEVIKVRQDVSLVIVGDGQLRKKLETQAKKLNLESYIKFVGARPHEEIPLWMNAADLFVLPSLREGFGVVQIEAMAVGTPVVATINGGSEEIIVSDDYGLLCPPADSRCLARKILTALNRTWDKEGITKYARRFTWDRVATEIFKVYRAVMRG